MDAHPTLLDLLRTSTAWLDGKGFANARRECEWIFSESLGLTRLELYTRFDMLVTTADRDRLRALLTRRARREPLAYVLGNQPFRRLKLAVSPAVLVPRPETEELIDLVLRRLPPTGPVRLLDIGTGSGAIAIALATERTDAQVDATDCSTEALAIARDNAQRHQAQVTFHHGHLARHLSGPYHAVVANLPYVGEKERHLCDPETTHEPALALFSGDDGLDLIRDLIADARRLLTPDGCLWLEHGFAQATAIAEIAASHHWHAARHLDLQQHPRFTCLTPTP